MRQPDIDGLFSKGSPEKMWRPSSDEPHQLSHSGKDSEVGGDFHFIKIGGLKVLPAADIVEIYKMAK